MDEFYIVNPIKIWYRQINVVEFFTLNFCYLHTQIRVYRETKDEKNYLETANVMVFKGDVLL